MVVIFGTITICVSPDQQNIGSKVLAAAQDMTMLCCRQEKTKKGKYPPVDFIRHREQEVFSVSSLALGDAW